MFITFFTIIGRWNTNFSESPVLSTLNSERLYESLPVELMNIYKCFDYGYVISSHVFCDTLSHSMSSSPRMGN